MRTFDPEAWNAIVQAMHDDMREQVTYHDDYTVDFHDIAANAADSFVPIYYSDITELVHANASIISDPAYIEGFEFGSTRLGGHFGDKVADSAHDCLVWAIASALNEAAFEFVPTLEAERDARIEQAEAGEEADW